MNVSDICITVKLVVNLGFKITLQIFSVLNEIALQKDWQQFMTNKCLDQKGKKAATIN